jgi:hypothetical protein
MGSLLYSASDLTVFSALVVYTSETDFRALLLQFFRVRFTPSSSGLRTADKASIHANPFSPQK